MHWICRLGLASLVAFSTTSAGQAQERAPSDAPAPEQPAAPADEQPAPSGKSLRFNFQRQPWGEVLRWLADQAELSLVLDSPPPGSFNYSDAKAYTTDEAIDLVNGVLASKGYTLLRRERMLMLINLQDEVPRTLVPRVALGEVERHGNYEFVTVTFPLEGRNAETALKEIQPLVSQFGKAAALSASGQLLVTDRAGVMRQIAAVLESMPRPASPSAPQAPAGTSEQPEFRVYPLAGADPGAAIEILKAIIDGKFVHDPGGERINAHATPSQHAVIEQLMQQVRGAAGKQQRHLEIYPIEGLSPERQTQLVADLQAGAAGATLRFDAANQQLVVWGTADVHVQLRRSLLTLLAAGGGTSRPAAQVYELKHVQASALLPILGPIVPAARLSQAGASRLLAIAPPQDQGLVQQLIEQLDQPARQEPLSIKEYQLQNDPPTELAELLTAAAPRAKIRIDAARKSVMVTGTDEDQQLLAQALRDVDQNLVSRHEQNLAIYVLTRTQQSRFADVRTSIEQLAPASRLVWNEKSGELFVWAAAEDQGAIEKLLNSLDAAPRRESTRKIRAYAALPSQLDGMAAMAAQVAPQAVTTVDRPGRRLLVWAEEDDHQKLEPILSPADEVRASSSAPLSYQAYPAGSLDMTLAISLLTDVFPQAKFQPDATARSIVVQADADAHREIEAMLRQLREGSLPRSDYQVVSYPLGGLSTTQVDSLRQLFPSMRISVDASTSQIGVWGLRDDHRQFRDALVSLGGNRVAEAPQIHLYQLKKAIASQVATGLQQLTPGVVTSVVNDAQLLVRCRPDLKLQVDELVAQLDVSRAAPQRQQVRAFPLRVAEPNSLRAALQSLFPAATGSQFSYDVQTRALTVVAEPEQMDLIQQVIETTDRQDAASAGERTLKAHSLTGVDGTTAVAALQEMFKEQGVRPLLSIDATRNRLVAVAAPAQQTLIVDVLASLAPQKTELEVFPLETMDPYAAEMAIRQLFGGGSGREGSRVEIESDDDGGRLLVRAAPGQLREIRALLLKLGETHLSAEDADAPGAQFVPWEADDPRQAMEQLERTWRQLRPNELRIAHEVDDAAAERPEASHASPAPLPPNLDGAPAATDEKTTDEARDPTGSAHGPPVSPPAAPSASSSAAPADAAERGVVPPVVVTPTPGGLVIASEDRAARAQFAALVRSLQRQRASNSAKSYAGDFSVFPLKNSSAQRVAAVLAEIYRQGRSGRRQLHFAADMRINAIVVMGTRSERREVEALLQTLDTSQATDYFKPDKPEMLKFKHVSASQVFNQLRRFYRTEIVRAVQQPPIEIPPGADPELAATLQQINAAREGPLLSLEVDADTNSLLAIAPRPLMEEIRQFVDQIDARGTESRMGVRVVPLESMKGDQILRSLDKIILERRK